MALLQSEQVGRIATAAAKTVEVRARTPARDRARRRIARFPPTPDINPYQRLLYDHLSELGFELEADATFTFAWLWRARRGRTYLHFHWRIDRLYRSCGLPAGPGAALLAARLLTARLLGYRLVWTIHQPFPHGLDGNRADRAAAKLLARACHVLLVHDAGHVPRARAALGRAAGRVDVVPHGSYVGFYPPGRSRLLVREELGIPADSFVFLCFGTLRLYKRLHLVLQAFLSLPDARLRLIVAGDPEDEEVASALATAASRDGRIVPLLGTVPHHAVAELFAASDAAVLGRGDGWTSGSLILALSHGIPVIAAGTPAYRALLDEERAGWLFTPDDPDSLRTALLAAAADPALARRRGEAALAVATSLSWSRAAEFTAGFLREP
jgi:beta-1,4-mannosyltransferase